MSNNPFGNYNPMTPQTKYAINNGLNNFNQAYSQPKHPLIDKTDFTNKKNMLHNNMHDLIQSECIYETEVYVNSSDRTTTIYPSMFNFTLKFGSANISGTGMSRTIISPYIDQYYERIKYVTIDAVTVPKTNIINIGTSTPILYSLSTTESDALFLKYKMLILSIEELKSNYVVSTGNLLTSDSFMLFIDKNAGCSNSIWKPVKNKRVYHNSALHKINKLTFKLKDQYGNILQYYDQDGNVFDLTSILSSLKAQVDAGGDANIQAQYNSLLDVSEQLQVIYVLTIGVMEMELNMIPQYEN